MELRLHEKSAAKMKPAQKHWTAESRTCTEARYLKCVDSMANVSIAHVSDGLELGSRWNYDVRLKPYRVRVSSEIFTYTYEHACNTSLRYLLSLSRDNTIESFEHMRGCDWVETGR
jgi:hypothetical protein